VFLKDRAAPHLRIYRRLRVQLSDEALCRRSTQNRMHSLLGAIAMLIFQGRAQGGTRGCGGAPLLGGWRGGYPGPPRPRSRLHTSEPARGRPCGGNRWRGAGRGQLRPASPGRRGFLLARRGGQGKGRGSDCSPLRVQHWAPGREAGATTWPLQSLKFKGTHITEIFASKSRPGTEPVISTLGEAQIVGS
jgi:hypothetical protein